MFRQVSHLAENCEEATITEFSLFDVSRIYFLAEYDRILIDFSGSLPATASELRSISFKVNVNVVKRPVCRWEVGVFPRFAVGTYFVYELPRLSKFALLQVI